MFVRSKTHEVSNHGMQALQGPQPSIISKWGDKTENAIISTWGSKS